MKISASCNTSPNSYQFAAGEVLDKYASFLEATPDDVVMAISFTQLTPIARDAIERSATALGFGEGRVAYATVTDKANRTLTETDLWRLIEGLDPLCLIVADEVTRRLIELAYNETLDTKGPKTIGGRRVAAFDDLEELLSTDAGKQRVWHGFKQLPLR